MVLHARNAWNAPLPLLPLLFAMLAIATAVTTGSVITTAPDPSLGLAIRLPVVLPVGVVIVEAHAYSSSSSSRCYPGQLVAATSQRDAVESCL